MTVTVTSKGHVLTLSVLNDQFGNPVSEQAERTANIAAIRVEQDGKAMDTITYAKARAAIDNARKSGLIVEGSL